MEKISIKKELYILNYEFLNFYTIFFRFLFDFLIEFLSENREKGKTYLRLTWRAELTWQPGPGDGLTWRAGPPRRYDVALRPRGRARVARAGRRWR